MTVNGIVPGVITEEAQKIGAGMIHYPQIVFLTDKQRILTKKKV